MVEQQVNFLRPHFLPVRPPLSYGKMAGIGAGLGLILTLLSLLGLQRMESQRLSLNELLRQEQDLLQQIHGGKDPEPAPPVPDKMANKPRGQFTIKNALLNQDIAEIRQQTEPFSEALRKMAQAQTPGIWLTTLTLNNLDLRWTLEGVTQSPEIIPDYLNKLNRQFSPDHPPFILNRVERNNTATTSAAIDSTGLLSFQLSTVPE
ncbi:MAG: hypothetical protein HQL67_08410 [Magnetococcales bacterium]|nr:hypothetical protein [Magnetococcales bacterium]